MIKRIIPLFLFCIFVVSLPLIAGDFSKADAAYKSGDYVAARKLLADYLKKNPKGADARRARLYLGDLEEKLAKAIDAYRRLVDEKKGDETEEMAQKAIAERFYLVSRYAEARENYGRFLELYPGSKLADEVRFWHATCHVLLNEIEKGMVLFEQLIERSAGGKRKTWAELALAECLLKLERAADAEKRLKGMLGTAAEKDFGNLVYFHLAECYEKQKKVAEASRAYRRVIQDYPGSFEVEEAKRRLELMRVEHPEEVGEGIAYSVQVGAFSRKDNARALADKLKKKGYAAYIVSEKARAGGVTLYRVRVGKHKTRGEAESQARMLGSKEDMPGMVVEVGQ